MANELDGNLARIAARVRRSTVRVEDPKRKSMGSGVVWQPQLIVTSAHVLRSDVAIVESPGGMRLRGSVVGCDRDRDLAALDVPQLDLEPVAVRSDRLRAGELVVAVGHPLGLAGALSTGLVQRCNAEWVVTDVNLAPGNSGGPLADATGRVTGINSMILRSRAVAVASPAVSAFLAHVLSAAAQAA